jgi:hypothetical protein
MQMPMNLRTPIHNLLFRFVALFLIAALLVGGAFTALPARPRAVLAQDRPVLAAGTCTSIADGSWSSPSTWDCGYVPTSADDAVVDNEITISSDQSVHNLTINFYGILTISSAVTLTVGGDFDVQGIFDNHEAGSGVVLDGTAQTILTHGDWVDFENLTKTAAGPGESLSVDPPTGSTGGIHILDTLTLQGTDPNYLALRSTVPGTQWQIYPQDTADVDWVDVQDSKNVSVNVIDVIHGIDSGNNTGWTFAGMSSSSVQVVSSINPSLHGKPVTFTATVSPLAATGTVTFQDGGVDITGCVSQTMVSAVATCTTSDLDVGSHSITAVYSGDATHDGSTSAVLTQDVLEIEATIYLPFAAKP